MKKLSQLLESINEIDSLLELDFKDKKAFKKYQAIHKMRPSTKVNIAGKDTTVGDEMGDDSEKPQAPKKTTGADIEKQADKSGKEVDDIEKDITGDLMGDEPKSIFSQISDENKDEFMDVVSDIDSNSGLDTIDVDKSKGGSGTYYNNITLPALKEKFPNGGDDFYEGVEQGIDSAIDAVGYIEDKKLKKKLEDELYTLSNDMMAELGDDYDAALGGFDKLPYKKMLPYLEKLNKFKKEHFSDVSKSKDEPKSDDDDRYAGAEKADAVDAALERFNDEVDLDRFEDDRGVSFDALMDIAADLEDSPIGDDEEFGDLYDDLIDNQDTESAENFKKYLDDQLKGDEPTTKFQGRTIPKAPKYDTPKKTGSKKPSSLDSYYAKEAAKRKWLSSNPGKTDYDWSRLPYGTMSDLIDKEMKARGFKENINLKELSKITTRYNK